MVLVRKQAAAELIFVDSVQEINNISSAAACFPTNTTPSTSGWCGCSEHTGIQETVECVCVGGGGSKGSSTSNNVLQLCTSPSSCKIQAFKSRFHWWWDERG